MTETLVGMDTQIPGPDPGDVELSAARELVRQAQAAGLSLTGPGGLLKQLTKSVIEAALDEEMSEHLGYDKHAVEGRNRGNSRNGTRAKTVLTDAVGAVGIDVPRDRDGTFTPKIVAKRQRRLSSVDEVVLSLYAKGLTTGEISAHFADVYGASISRNGTHRAPLLHSHRARTKQRPFPHRRLCCPRGSIGTTTASDSLPAPAHFPAPHRL